MQKRCLIKYKFELFHQRYIYGAWSSFVIGFSWIEKNIYGLGMLGRT